MKGIVFTEFLEMTEAKFGFKMVDKIIIESDLASGGIYTTVGTYDEEEFFILLDKLSKEVLIDKKVLLVYLGEQLCAGWMQKNNCSLLIHKPGDTFLDRFENYIKNGTPVLYSKSMLPEIELNHFDKNKLVITYHVAKRVADLIEGMIIGSINLCKEKIKVFKQDRLISNESAYTFTLEKQ